MISQDKDPSPVGRGGKKSGETSHLALFSGAESVEVRAEPESEPDEEDDGELL